MAEDLRAGANTFYLFDLDGTLLRLGWVAPKPANEPANEPPPDITRWRQRAKALLAALDLRPPMGMMVTALATAGATVPEAQEVVDGLEHAAARGARPCHFAAEVLARLQGRPVAIISNNGAACAKTALAVAGLPTAVFDAILCREQISPWKPDPAPLRHALAILQERHGPPDEVWMIGDAVTDIQAALALRASLPAPPRVRAIGVCGGLCDADALRAAGADEVLLTLEALPVIF